MKIYKDLFKKICSFQNLHLAYLKARRCKRYREEILRFSYNLERNLLNLRQELLSQTYWHGGYREFVVFEQKRRQIKAAPFRDRVVHHALCHVIEPIFDKGFIDDSYACRKNKGTHKAIKRLEGFIKSAESKSKKEEDKTDLYCLQCDVSKYFANIDHKILLGLIKKKIADRKAFWLVQKILNSSYETKSGVGIPLGNLTSQLFANIYLNELDQFVKHQLKEKYYLRYMDDFLILSFDKKKLHKIKNEIEEFLQRRLRLELHPKKVNVFPINKSIDFLGYRIFSNYRLLRKSTIKRFIKRTKLYQKRLKKGLTSQEKFKNSLKSWIVYAEFGNSWRLRQDLSKRLKISLIK